MVRSKWRLAAGATQTVIEVSTNRLLTIVCESGNVTAQVGDGPTSYSLAAQSSLIVEDSKVVLVNASSNDPANGEWTIQT